MQGESVETVPAKLAAALHCPAAPIRDVVTSETYSRFTPLPISQQRVQRRRVKLTVLRHWLNSLYGLVPLQYQQYQLLNFVNICHRHRAVHTFYNMS